MAIWDPYFSYGGTDITSIEAWLHFSIDAIPEKAEYKRGETVSVTISVRNKAEQETIWLGVSFKDTTGESAKYDPEIIITPESATIVQNEIETFTAEWTIPDDAPAGVYKIAVNCWKDNTFTDWYSDDLEWASIFNVSVIAKEYIHYLQVGQYTAYDIHVPIGLMNEYGTRIGDWGDYSAFALPEHVEADFLWFGGGWMQWEYPLDIPSGSKIESIAYTVEISSEHARYMTDWPSDVTISINGVVIDTWTVPGDPGFYSFGNDRYGLQENHLPYDCSQYGWLCTWTINNAGVCFEYNLLMGMG